ncbi:MAG: hypothetical protein ABJB22_00700 [Verrucomicrobiota bacterium]
MAEMAVRVGGALVAYGSVANDAKTKGQGEVTMSTFSRARDDQRDGIAQGVLDAANGKLADLADYGITAATITAFQTRINAYKAGSSGPQVAQAQKSTITGLLEQEFTRADIILDERLDKLMLQFKGSGTTFYDDYQNARKVIDSKGGKAKTPTPPAPPTP